MSFHARTATLAAALLVSVASVATAQEHKTVMADLLFDVTQAEEKIMGLARAMPEESYSWRPGEGVRSVGEVFQHVAADNYLLPALQGIAAPAETGIKPDDYQTAVAYETREIDREAIIADLETSFAHLKQAMSDVPGSKLGDELSVFGQTFTARQLWVLTVTHLHEHLGQSIAYARTNGVKPPWSR
jgi:uncharacterized damage-inducible protein DinB